MMGRQRRVQVPQPLLLAPFTERIRQVIFKGNIPGAQLQSELRLEMINI